MTEEEKVRITTDTADIIRVVEKILFNPDHKSNEDVLNETVLSLYGTLVVFGIAGYDLDQLKEVVSEAVDTCGPLITDLREQLSAHVRRKAN
jgi:hypothetical protein